MQRRTKTADRSTCRPTPRPRLEQLSEIARAEMLNVCDSVDIGMHTLLHEWQIFKNWLSMYAYTDSGKNKTIIGQTQQRKINVHNAMNTWNCSIDFHLMLGFIFAAFVLYIAYECERFHASKKRTPSRPIRHWYRRRACLVAAENGPYQLEFIGTNKTDGKTTVWEIMIIEMRAAVFSNEERRKCRRYVRSSLRHILIKLAIVLELLHCQAAG